MSDTQSSIEYIGPPGQDSPALGPLVPGRVYQIESEMAKYLTSRHPDYWRAPKAKKAAADKES